MKSTTKETTREAVRGAIITALAIFGAMFLLLALFGDASAQGVKYCKNAETGEIIVVEEGMPCPFPTHKI